MRPSFLPIAVCPVVLRKTRWPRSGACPAAGVRWLEVDVRLTADDVAVVIHDETVDATTNGFGRVSEMSAAAIDRLDAGSWFAGAFRGEKVPTLRAVLHEAALLGLNINLELKAEPRREISLAQAVAAKIARYWPQSAPPPLVSSRSARALRAFHQLAPDIPLGVVLKDPAPNWRREFTQVPFSVIVVNVGWITAERLRSLKRHGAVVLAYTVNRRRKARAMISLGVDGVFTDYPDILSGVRLPPPLGRPACGDAGAAAGSVEGASGQAFRRREGAQAGTAGAKRAPVVSIEFQFGEPGRGELGGQALQRGAGTVGRGQHVGKFLKAGIVADNQDRFGLFVHPAQASKQDLRGGKVERLFDQYRRVKPGVIADQFQRLTGAYSRRTPGSGRGQATPLPAACP